MNSIERVTQAANRLFAGLKLPDGSGDANRTLGDMRFPQFSRLLPYRDYDKETGFFVNATTVGFLLEATPLTGANPDIVGVLENLLRTKVPRKVPLSFHLVSSKVVGPQIDEGMQDFSWSGKQAELFNGITRAYYMKAAQTQFNSPTGLPLTLRDYRLYISFAVKGKRTNRQVMMELNHTLKVMRATLESARISAEPADDVAFLRIVSEMVNHRPHALYRPEVRVDEFSELNYQCVESSFDLQVYPDHLSIGLNSPGEKMPRARVMNFMLEKNPEMFALWQGGDNISNLLSTDLTISCPFVMTLSLVVEDQASTQTEANMKYLDLEKRTRTSYVKFFPNTANEAREWGELRTGLNSGQTSLVRYYFNVTAFCEDDDEVALRYEQQIINTFRKNGLFLYSPTYMQMRNYLSMFPFMAGEGVFDELKISGATCRARTDNVANLLPVVADNRLCAGGLLVPSYRNQLAFLDIFADYLGNTNYNMAVCGTSGAGKTGLIQPTIRQVLDSGGDAWIFDMGDGYKSLCENMGGVYLHGENLKFNPFANVIDIQGSAERIRDQLSVLASPNGTLDEVHESLLLQGVVSAWEAKQNNALIDDVVAYLKVAKDSEQYKESERIVGRMDEIIILLEKYTTTGVYGRYFTSSEPSLSDGSKMVVLELGGLKSRPDLLVAVMFSLIIYIENRMYQSSRAHKKICVIDEGWQLLNFNNAKVGNFIETGYRTARRHRGAYITITQNIKDFDAPDASAAAKAAWGNSSYKIILKQDAKEFKAYNLAQPNQFSRLETDVIGKFGNARDQWFSSFMLSINDTNSWHRLFVDPLSRAMFSSTGKDFEYIQQRRQAGVHIHDAVYELARLNWPEEMNALEAWVAEEKG